VRRATAFATACHHLAAVSSPPHARQELLETSQMADIVIRGGTVVDGTGAPTRVADVAIKDGKILAIGSPHLADVVGAEEVDATGLLVCPGWVDCHTHYDAQVGWDPTMSPSCWHGVTTVVFVSNPSHRQSWYRG
jgi:N-acyl-D-aspartate/D-glutamate deacylase